MKKNIAIFLLFFGLLSLNYASADELDPGGWDSIDATAEKGFEGQKPITDAQFNKTIKQIQERKGGKKKKKNEITPLSPVPYKNNPYDNNEMQSLYNNLTTTPTVMFSSFVIAPDGTVLSPGYYKLTNKQINRDEYIFELSQGSQIFAKVPARQTVEDFNEDKINFFKVSNVDDKYMRIIYGTMDLNLEGRLYIKNSNR